MSEINLYAVILDKKLFGSHFEFFFLCSLPGGAICHHLHLFFLKKSRLSPCFDYASFALSLSPPVHPDLLGGGGRVRSGVDF